MYFQQLKLLKNVFQLPPKTTRTSQLQVRFQFQSPHHPHATTVAPWGQTPELIRNNAPELSLQLSTTASPGGSRRINVSVSLILYT